MLRFLKYVLKKNCILIFAIVLGYFMPYLFIREPIQACVSDLAKNAPVVNKSKPQLIKKLPTKNPNETKKEEKVVRPRFYSTELGIRDKLFVGVLTSEDKINTQAVYINQTIGHIVSSLKFFITVKHKMQKMNLSGIVGFTDTREKLRPFHIIKYIGDNFLQEYDYYFLMRDYNYLNVRRLLRIISKINVSRNVYLGKAVEESSSCSLESGVLLSNSVMKAMRKNLDWCVSNAVLDDHSENLGCCVHYSVNLECQEEVQNQNMLTYKFKHFYLEKYFAKLVKRKEFNEAVTVFPVLQAKDFYLLNAYFLRLTLERLKYEIKELKKDVNDTWPPGEKVAAKPATRFDFQRQIYFNMTHAYFTDDFTFARLHSVVELKDIQNVIEVCKTQILPRNVHNLEYRRLVNGYKAFDLTRGMDYKIDLGFRDRNTGKEIVKRFEVCKPLGGIEFIPVPYVTESTRVAILLPIQENEIKLAADFIANYNKIVQQQHEKVFLVLVLLYQYDSVSKGVNDVFRTVKQMAQNLSVKFHNEDARIIWVSIRLPLLDRTVLLHQFKMLNFAIVDLALKKVGLDLITLLVNVYADVSVEFLNRVRMNTIGNFQIFSPIPFKYYNPKVTGLQKFDIDSNSGHFDRDEYFYISFYGRDYVSARKRLQSEVPIVKTDNDIAQIIAQDHGGNIFEMFLKHSDDLHCMRATEKELTVRYHEHSDSNKRNQFLGTKLQLAKNLLKYQDQLKMYF